MKHVPYHHSQEETDGDLIQQCLDAGQDELIWPELPKVPKRRHTAEHKAKISASMKTTFRDQRGFKG